MALAKKLIPAKKKPPQIGVSFSTSQEGNRTVAITGSERDITDLEYELNRNLDASKPAGPQLVQSFLNLMRGGGGVAPAVPRPQLLIPLPEYVRIITATMTMSSSASPTAPR
ncbi:hypothetical protein [Corynebacterium tuscaniense]|uniref:hypothetical protein n=1 Tax=Corynebacterium tuscaniense TaxID=302449 RepID=UPI00123B318C|nr:hypothetical protein [Corynebacterium tuscaniense]KAA8740369.1 hypothetical protein F4V54_04930 [Corynebacterium tuscaniense]